MPKHLFLLTCTVLALSACGRDEIPPESAPPPTASSGDGVAPGTAAIAPADPSTPASGVVGGSPNSETAGQDRPSNSSDGEMTKQEESQTMPQPGQANNYSSPARDEKPGTGDY